MKIYALWASVIMALVLNTCPGEDLQFESTGDSVTSFAGQPALKSADWELFCNHDGSISSIKYLESGVEIPFFEQGQVGPTFYFIADGETVVPELARQSPTLRKGVHEDLSFSIEYKEENGRLMWLMKIRNGMNAPFQPTTLGIRVGLNTYMDHYPDWESRFFPSLIRCEATHFWGYAMSPLGGILAIASPDPIASWSHEYSKSHGRPPNQFEGHRITSLNIDLINALPLPERHPQNLWQILPGEQKVFRIYFDEVSALDNIGAVLAEMTRAPWIDLESTSLEADRSISFAVTSPGDFELEIVKPNGERASAEILDSARPGQFRFSETSQTGLYQIEARAAKGKRSQGSFYVRKPYSWYMDKAMQAVIDYPQRASKTHCEAWYGFYTTYMGAMHNPEHPSIESADQQFQAIFGAILDPATLGLLQVKHRIQNISSLIGILVARYGLFNDEEDIQKALRLAGHLMKAQSADGAYRAGRTHYTSVIYPAKSLMELLHVLETSGLKSKYQSDYDRIAASVKMAVDELERSRTNIQTEGEMTFEDGMISCTALQLAAFALRQTEPQQREKYSEAATAVLTQHECLQQLVVPDARMRSGTHRFWEAQYDVLIGNNFINSPHGWSSWATYANYYAYLLTGQSKYLIRTFNGLNAAMQMIDQKTGKLRWAFMVNPYVEVKQIANNIPGATAMNFPGVHYHVNAYGHNEYIAGESYVDMVSDWFMANANDNDVHEHFKCLSEVALDKAYVIQMAGNNEFLAFNCSVEFGDGVLHIHPSESIIDRVHVNIRDDMEVSVSFAESVKTVKIKQGMTWIDDARQ
jgi:hypothetical protein